MFSALQEGRTDEFEELIRRYRVEYVAVLASSASEAAQAGFGIDDPHLSKPENAANRFWLPADADSAALQLVFREGSLRLLRTRWR